MMLGRQRMRTRARFVGRVSAAPALPFNTVNSVAWNVQYTATPPGLNPLQTFTVNRKGFDDTGSVLFFDETLTATQRVRQVFPNEASLTALTVAISDYILSTDSVSGASNLSGEAGPTPIANWCDLDRQLLGTEAVAEITGNHWFARNGRPFRAVKVRWTDNLGNFVEATTTAMTVSPAASDKNKVLVYRVTADISGLADGLITRRGWVYPWVGESVADSSLSSVAREFSPRHDLKNASRFLSPPFAYVSATPSGSPVASTNAATAKASPFGSLQAAIDGLVAAFGTVDGCRIRIMDAVNFGTIAGNKAQQCAAVIVERDPDVAKSAAVLTLAATWRPRLGVGTLLAPLTEGAIWFRDLTLTRTGVFTIQGEAANNLRVMISDDVDWNNAGHNSSWLNNSHLYTSGAIVTNATGSSVFSAATGEIRMFRGVSVNRGGNSTEGWLVLGTTITAPGLCSYGSRSESGAIIQFNRFLSYASTTNSIINWAASTSSTALVSNCSFAQNLIEVIHTTTSNPSVRASSDSSWQPVYHVLIDNNTVACGHFQAGRMNLFYDETRLVNRLNKFCRVRNTVAGGYYIKSDVFVGLNGNGSPNPVDAPNHIGNWGALYGTGYKNLITLLVNTGANIVGEDEGPAYPGAGSVIATSQTVQSPATTAWTNWQATTTNTGTGVAVAGAGGGDYTLPGGSPLLGIVSSADEIFPFDLNGVARTRGAVGAYA